MFVRESLEVGKEPVIGRFDVFGNSPDIGDDAYKIMIAMPARDNVEMEMIGDSRPGNGADIAADIETVRGKVSLQDGRGLLHSFHQGKIFFGGKLGDTAYMARGRNQEMAIGIGKAIEQDKRQFVSIKKEKILVGPGGPARLEETVTDLWGIAEDMFNSPGSPERFHKF